MANRVHYHTSLIDTDLYKLSMQNAICRLYPKIKTRYTFKNRDNREFPDGFDKRLREIVDFYRSDDMLLQQDEYDFLKEKCYYLNPVYLDFLRGYRYDPTEVTIKQTGPKLEVTIEGFWYRTVTWEVPLMATISELYFEMTNHTGDTIEKRHITNRDKATKLAALDVFFSEFGTRRRYSFENQEQMIKDMKKFSQGHMLGTSNIYMAMKYDLIPMGTVAHEFYSAHGAMFGYKMANEMTNDAWIQVYQGSLGTALTDTFTTDVFFKSFNTKYAKLFDGIRQDSGDPIAFIEKAVNHYKKLRINPMYKYAMFSDNLKSIDQIRAIHDACRDKIIDRYGIGTWLSNDVANPLNIVIKLTGVNWDGEWVPTVKLSDDPMKNTGDPDEIALCRQVLKIS
jgi:nicotinate phosphoribosyltransferase